MPNGSFQEFEPNSLKMMTYVNGSLRSNIDSSRTMQLARKGNWYRAGGSGLRGLSTKKVYDGPYAYRAFWVRKGKKLPFKRMNPKTGKFIWARELVKVYKLVRLPSKVTRSFKGDNVEPNYLNYRFIRHDVPPGNTTSLTASNVQGYDVRREYVGDLFDGYTPAGAYSPLYRESPGQFIEWTDYQDKLIELNARATAKLYSKISDQKVNIAQAFAERMQTLALLGDLAARLVNAYAALRTGKLNKLFKALFPPQKGMLADTWLMTQYGLKPLIDDINGLIDHWNDRPEFAFAVKASSKDEVVTIREYESFDAIRVRTKVTTTATVVSKYKAWLTMEGVYHRNFAKLGFTSPAAVVYELVPFSFVLDWALPIGNFLASKNALDGLRVVRCTRTSYIKVVTKVERHYGGLDNQGFLWSDGVSKVNTTQVYVNRALVPMPDIPFPGFKNPFSSLHLLNALALFSSSKLR